MTRSLSKKLSFLYKKKQDTLNATGYKLQEVALLKQSINNAAVCKNCKSSRGKLEILSKPNKRHGLAESMLLRCTLCNHKTPLETSPKVSPSLHLQKKKKSKVYDINIRSVLASFANGIGHSGLKQLCADLNLHAPVQKLSFNNITKLISKATDLAVQEELKCSGQKLMQEMLENDPDNVHVNEHGDVVADVAVTVDGTWQKRGHTSKIGVIYYNQF